MLAAIFGAMTIICACGWLCHYIGSAALARYMLDKGYTPPSDEELRTCTTYVIKKMLHVR